MSAVDKFLLLAALCLVLYILLRRVFAKERREEAVIEGWLLLDGKIDEMLDDPFTTDYKWREILPACRMVDEECRRYVPWAESIGYLEERVLRIMDPDRDETTIA